MFLEHKAKIWVRACLLSACDRPPFGFQHKVALPFLGQISELPTNTARRSPFLDFSRRPSLPSMTDGFNSRWRPWRASSLASDGLYRLGWKSLNLVGVPCLVAFGSCADSVHKATANFIPEHKPRPRRFTAKQTLKGTLPPRFPTPLFVVLSALIWHLITRAKKTF